MGIKSLVMLDNEQMKNMKVEKKFGHTFKRIYTYLFIVIALLLATTIVTFIGLNSMTNNYYQQNTYQPNGYQQNNYQQNGYQQPVQFGAVTGSERGLAWLAYILVAPAFLVPLFVKKTSEYCRFHVKQGATLWAISTAYWIFELIFLAIINAIFPGRYYYAVYYNSAIYNVFAVILGLGFLALSVFAVIGIVFAATGKQKELPLISKIPWVGMLIDKIYNAINK
jgi:hypothetical protein